MDALLAGLDGPDDVADAVQVAGEAISTSALRAEADAVGSRIAGASVVALDATPTLATVIAVVGAALGAGVPIVPIPPDAGPRERDHIMADSGAAAVLRARADATRRVAIETVAGRRAGRPVSADAALILYTSGTTGPPKGVVIGRAAIAAGLDGLVSAWDWTPDDVLVHGLPLFHVHGLVLGVLGALRVGSRLVHTGRPTPDAYAAAGGSLYFGVPTVWSRIAADAAAGPALRAARLLVSGSAPLPIPVFERLAALSGQAPVERYGMTETLITVSVRADGERRPGWVGRPIAGVESRLVPLEDGPPVPLDGETVGELQIRGATLMAGYHQQPTANATAFTDDGWFRTGDVACVDVGGYHRIVGRRSTDLIKSGGYRIGAGEIEGALLAHPAVREAAVVGEPDDDLGQVVVAYVVADGVVGTDLIDFVATTLSVHKRPRRVELVGSLPRNAMGKVQKSLLLGG